MTKASERNESLNAENGFRSHIIESGRVPKDYADASTSDSSQPLPSDSDDRDERTRELLVLDRISRKIAEHMGFKRPHILQYRILFLASFICAGIAYGLLLARVVANPQVWSGLAAVVVPLIVGAATAVKTLQTRQDEKIQLDLKVELACMVLAGAISLVFSILLMDWGWLGGTAGANKFASGVAKRIEASEKQLNALNIKVDDRIDEFKNEVTNLIASVRSDSVLGYRHGVVAGKTQALGRARMAAGQVLASNLLFNISPDEGPSKRAVLSNIGLRTAAHTVIYAEPGYRIRSYYYASEGEEVDLTLRIDNLDEKENPAGLPFRFGWSVKKLDDIAVRKPEADTEIKLDGSRIHGTISGTEDRFWSDCIATASPDRIYEFNLKTRQRILVFLEPEFHAAVTLLQHVSGDRVLPLACNQAMAYAMQNNSEYEKSTTLEVALSPGRYMIVVEGLGRNRGSFALVASKQELQGSSCQKPVALTERIQTLPPFHPLTSKRNRLIGQLFATFDVPGDSPRYRKINLQGVDPNTSIKIRKTCDEAPIAQGTAEKGVDFESVSSQRYILEIETSDWRSDMQPTIAQCVDICTNAPIWHPGEEWTGSLTEAGVQLAPSCRTDVIGWGSAIRTVTVTQRSRLLLSVKGEGTEILSYILSGCGSDAAELACDSNPRMPHLIRLNTILNPGRYWVVVQGSVPSPSAFNATYSLRPL